jgi:radical SAM superfamily enzyme YgiQ (UPF0313 family)
VAGLTPPGHEVTYLEVDDLDSLGALPDIELVGISSFTARIEAAYALADRFRARGVPVVLGGIHVSLMPDEALAHADVVVVGGAEGAWPHVVADAERGRLGRVYTGARERVFEPDLYAVPRFDLLEGRPYNRVTVQSSRGCPRACEFCAASLRITSRFNQKPVDRVIAEIRAARRHVAEPFFELADDNSFLDRRWTDEFLHAVTPEGIRYFTETDVSVADDPRLCDRLAASGCRQLLIGFGEVLEFVRSSGLAEVQYTVLTPFPGTPLHARLRREGRLLEERFWDRCTLFDVTFVPKRMTVEELEAGLRWLFRETYTRQETEARLLRFVAQRRDARLAAYAALGRGPSDAPVAPEPAVVDDGAP